MTTRRFRGGGQGGSSPNKPNVRLGARARVPEREITITDVTQHASEILTDQDFVITAPSEGDYFRHDGSNWVNVSAIPAGDIPEGHVTQHQAALSIAASQIAFSPGVGLPVPDRRDDNDPPSTFDKEWLVEFKRLSSVGLTGGGGTYSGQITIAPWSDNSGDAHHQINLNEGGLFWRQGQPDDASWGVWSRIHTDPDPTGDEKMRLRGDATGDPYISFYQDGTRKGYLQYLDSSNMFLLNNEGGARGLEIRGDGDDVLRLRTDNSGGNPYLSFYQAGTRRAYIQWNSSSTRLRFNAEEAGATMDWILTGNIVLQLKNDDLTNVRGDVIATV